MATVAQPLNAQAFRKCGVRYIAINDNFDTSDQNGMGIDMAGIKNWINEFYARDTSRKIRAVNKSKGSRGIPLTTNVPYGYMKNPDDPTRWLVDEEAAIVVKYIFKMAMEGCGPSQIATQLTQAEKRVAELDRLFVKIYEDNAKGKLSDERFSMMSGNYEAEQKKFRMVVVELQKNIEEQERQNERLEKFIQKAKHYQDLNSLTPDALRDMVSAIYVGAPDKSYGKRQQKIEIYYDGAGFIPLNLLMQRETA